MLIGTLLMLVLAKPFYRLWLGEGKVIIPFALSFGVLCTII